MRVSVSVATTASAMPQIMFAEDLERRAAFLAGLGYDGVDLFFPDPVGTDARHIAAVLEKNGLAVTMLAAQGDIMADGLFLNNSDPAGLEALLERSRRHLEAAALLRAMPNVGFLRGSLPPGEDARRDSLARMAEGLRRYCDLAASFGVGVLLEPICRYEINSCNTVAQCLDLMAAAGNPEGLALLLDVFHMNIEEASLTGAVDRAAGRIGHVHFVDNTRGVPGSGCLPLAALHAALARAGYKGFLGIEAVPGENPEAEAASGLAFVRALG